MKRIKVVFTLVSIMVLLGLQSLTVMAVPGRVYFGSTEYTPEFGKEFPVGVYVESAATIGAYEIHLSYDAQMLSYTQGATSGGNGEIVISGDAQSSNQKTMVYFNPLQEGVSQLKVTAVQVQAADGSGSMTITELPGVTITVMPGEHVAPQMLYCNGEEVEDFDADTMSYELSLPEGEEVVITDENEDELSLEVVDEDEESQTIEAIYDNGEEELVYTFHVTWTETEDTEEGVSEVAGESATNEDIPDADNETEVEIEDMDTVSSGEEDAISVMSQPSDAEVAKSIRESRQKELLKGGLIIAFLLVVMVIIGIANIVRNAQMKKSDVKERRSRVEADGHNIEFESIDSGRR